MLWHEKPKNGSGRLGVPSKVERGVKLRSIRLGKLGGVIANAKGARPQSPQYKPDVFRLQVALKQMNEEDHSKVRVRLALLMLSGSKDNG